MKFLPFLLLSFVACTSHKIKMGDVKLKDFLIEAEKYCYNRNQDLDTVLIFDLNNIIITCTDNHSGHTGVNKDKDALK